MCVTRVRGVAAKRCLNSQMCALFSVYELKAEDHYGATDFIALLAQNFLLPVSVACTLVRHQPGHTCRHAHGGGREEGVGYAHMRIAMRIARCAYWCLCIVVMRDVLCRSRSAVYNIRACHHGPRCARPYCSCRGTSRTRRHRLPMPVTLFPCT